MRTNDLPLSKQSLASLAIGMALHAGCVDPVGDHSYATDAIPEAAKVVAHPATYDGAPRDAAVPAPADAGPCGAHSPSTSDAGAPSDAAATPAQCVGIMVGDTHVCSSFDALKLAVSTACERHGGITNAMKPGEPCEGGSFGMWAECCGGEPAPRNALVCESLQVGDPAVCSSDLALKLAALDACAAQGASLERLDHGEPCSGGARGARAECCGLPAACDAGGSCARGPD